MIKGAYVILAALLLATKGAAAEPIRIGVSDFIYADLARQIGDPVVAITLLRPETATNSGVTVPPPIELVLCSGTKADVGLCDSAMQTSPPPIVIQALHYTTSHQQDSEFLFYDFKAMMAFAQQLAAELSRLAPTEAPRIAANLARTQQGFRAIDLKIDEIAKVYRGSNIIITDSRFGGIVERLHGKVQDDTYVKNQQHGIPPSAKSIATLKDAIQLQDASILLYDDDAATPAIKNLVAYAKDHGTPAVGLRQTLPRGLHYQQWMLRQLNAINGALNEAAP
ncbi:MAG TPA: zinc ABC transporter substrate-binding protein [Xanthobacteraceae bacterium]|jgi:zinc/manganese transport system substrate-binding protein